MTLSTTPRLLLAAALVVCSPCDAQRQMSIDTVVAGVASEDTKLIDAVKKGLELYYYSVDYQNPTFVDRTTGHPDFTRARKTEIMEWHSMTVCHIVLKDPFYWISELLTLRSYRDDTFHASHLIRWYDGAATKFLNNITDQAESVQGRSVEEHDTSLLGPFVVCASCPNTSFVGYPSIHSPLLSDSLRCLQNLAVIGREKVDDLECIIVKGRKGEGPEAPTYTFALSPDTGWRPIRATVLSPPFWETVKRAQYQKHGDLWMVKNIVEEHFYCPPGSEGKVLLVVRTREIAKCRIGAVDERLFRQDLPKSAFLPPRTDKRRPEEER